LSYLANGSNITIRHLFCQRNRFFLLLTFGVVDQFPEINILALPDQGDLLTGFFQHPNHSEFEY